ncbi:hypothetical protein LOY97_005752 [Ophidiomyces ophidiicola]|nr:hypothetical protein LOY97_005752 [Ophidiomyces ophidiicola]
MSQSNTAAAQKPKVAAMAAQQSDNIAHALAGAGGGILSMILTAQVESKRAQSSTIDALRHIIKREGVKGLYAGLESALFGISVTNFVYYYWYEWTRAAFEKAAHKSGRASKKLTTLESMIAGAIAGSATVMITNPIWVVNTRMTARKSDAEESLPGAPAKKPKTTLNTLLTLLREEGPKALFSGVLPALILVINPILQYTFFEQLKNALEKRRKVTPTDAFYLGALGKLLATSITYPYITVKSRMHVAAKDGPKESLNASLKRIIKEEGWSGLYKGIGPKVSQSVLTAAFLFAFKDVLYDTMVAARRRTIRKIDFFRLPAIATRLQDLACSHRVPSTVSLTSTISAMDTNFLVNHVNEVRDELWCDKIYKVLQTNSLCEWVSTFHPDKCPCQVYGMFRRDSFNAGGKMVFSDGTAWMVRFPRGGKTSIDYADEKVAMEVTTLSLIREKTTIPVPKVHAWGVAAENPLGLGPFIMMDFTEGLYLDDFLKSRNVEKPTNLMRENIRDNEVEIIYRQMANYMLQLFKLDSHRIGSLPWPGAGSKCTTPPRPLTFKAHTILQDGGVNTFGDRHRSYATTTEYFCSVFEQDLEQLVKQPNTVYYLDDGKAKYEAFHTLRSLIPDLAILSNLIVRSEDDLTVLGVVDLEWSYTGPAQLFGSVPWWLLQDRPINPEWDYENGKPPEVAPRYFRYLEFFVRILEEEEAKMPGNEEKELSTLVKWSQSSGAMWLHMLLSVGFNDDHTFPFAQLREHFQTKWGQCQKAVINIEERDAFAAQKVRDSEHYEEMLEKVEADKELLSSGKMTKEEFVANALMIISGSTNNSYETEESRKVAPNGQNQDKQKKQQAPMPLQSEPESSYEDQPETIAEPRVYTLL